MLPDGCVNKRNGTAFGEVKCKIHSQWVRRTGGRKQDNLRNHVAGESKLPSDALLNLMEGGEEGLTAIQGTHVEHLPGALAWKKAEE